MTENRPRTMGGLATETGSAASPAVIPCPRGREAGLLSRPTRRSALVSSRSVVRLSTTSLPDVPRFPSGGGRG